MASNWLDDLEPGDVVVVDSRVRDLYISKVQRVTKTLIILEHDVRISKKHGVNPGEVPSVHIRQPEPKLLDEIRHNGLVAKLQRVKWEELSITVLVQILAIERRNK